MACGNGEGSFHQAGDENRPEGKTAGGHQIRYAHSASLESPVGDGLLLQGFGEDLLELSDLDLQAERVERDQ